jgi:hypothetical protein
MIVPGAPEARKGFRGSPFVLALLVLIGCSDGGRSRIMTGAAKVKAVESSVMAALLKDGDAERSFQELLPAYERDLKPALTGKWERDCDGDCLAALFSVVGTVSGYSYGQADPELPDLLMTIYRKLKADDRATARQALEVKRSLVKFRRFDEARAFAEAERLGGERIPPLVIPDAIPATHRVIDYATDGLTLSIRTRTLGAESVIMISGPTCTPSKGALAAIFGDPALRRMVLPDLTIIGPPSGEISAGYFSGWNRLHPRLRQAQAYSAKDWPEVADWDKLPTFYFVARGKVVARQSGWGPESLARFRENARALRAAGAVAQSR